MVECLLLSLPPPLFALSLSLSHLYTTLTPFLLLITYSSSQFLSSFSIVLSNSLIITFSVNLSLLVQFNVVNWHKKHTFE